MKDFEFRLPLSLTRAAMTVHGLKSPYVPVDDDLRAIFIHIPKAAGTSVRRALYGTKSFHIPAARYRAADKQRFDTYFKFCFVRNPWDRVCSAYHYLWSKREAEPTFPDHRWAAYYLSDVSSFEDFIGRLEDDPSFRSAIRRYIHFRDQRDWITAPGARGRPLVDFIGRYEQLNEDYRVLEDQLGLTATLPSERVRAGRQDYRRMYDSRMVDIVARIYAADIGLFGYDFE